ncbi:MAG: COX15/CtaA family protein [Acidobacteria bacterium]|nr:COX15/CtaA family protein [Acidobacteriota bacterium]
MQRRTFERLAWAFLAYLVGVILFGAWVRITHSGAGCGNHWPTCNGTVLPLDPSLETAIEFTHRVTSGLCGVFGAVFVAAAWRIYGRGPVLAGAALTLLFVVFEGLVGAGLVLGELVEDDASVARAVVIAIHLANTLLLTASAAVTAWCAGGRPAPAFRSLAASSFGPALLLIVAASMTGAVTALGDTLFPTQSTLGPGLFDKVRGDLGAANHFLVRLRAVHPVVAILTAGWLAKLTAPLAFSLNRGAQRTWARWAFTAVVAEVCLGLLNIALAAPGWLQLAHLLVAQALWVCLLLTGVAAQGGASEAAIAGPDLHDRAVGQAGA